MGPDEIGPEAGDDEFDDELEEILQRTWPAIREQVWLSLPRHWRRGPFRPLPVAGISERCYPAG
jgi:hypothetical protein